MFSDIKRTRERFLAFERSTADRAEYATAQLVALASLAGFVGLVLYVGATSLYAIVGAL